MSKHRYSKGLAFIMLLSFLPSSANDVIDKYLERIALQQQRIDLIDGAEDQFIRLKSDLQSSHATATYITSTNRIIETLLNDALLPDVQKVDQLKKLQDLLKGVNPRNIHFYTQFKPVFELIQKVQKIDDTQRLNSILKSNVFASLNLIAFYVEKPVAEPFFMTAARTEPA